MPVALYRFEEQSLNASARRRGMRIIMIADSPAPSSDKSGAVLRELRLRRSVRPAAPRRVRPAGAPPGTGRRSLALRVGTRGHDRGPAAERAQLGDPGTARPNRTRSWLSPSSPPYPFSTTTASVAVRKKQSSACSGDSTIGSFSLKLVFSTTGVSVFPAKAEMSAWCAGLRSFPTAWSCPVPSTWVTAGISPCLSSRTGYTCCMNGSGAARRLLPPSGRGAAPTMFGPDVS